MAYTPAEFLKLKLPEEPVRLCHDGNGPDPQCDCPDCESYYDDLGNLIEEHPIGLPGVRRTP